MGIRVLFIYPNTYGMNMLPPALALFSALLKGAGHQVEIFDSTYYQTDYGIDSDGTKMEFLNVVPYDLDGRGIRLRTTDWREDLTAQLNRFQPHLIAISSTEDMWELGLASSSRPSPTKFPTTFRSLPAECFQRLHLHLPLRLRSSTWCASARARTP